MSHLSGYYDLLLISAGECSRRKSARGRTDVKGFDLLLRVLVDAIGVEHPTICELALEPEHEIVSDRVVENQTSAVTILGNMSESSCSALRH